MADFITSGSGGEVEKAFLGAKAEAAREFRHCEYTGTIAEKDSIVLVADSPMSRDAAEKYAVHLLNTDDERIRDKRGPAGTIPVSDGHLAGRGLRRLVMPNRAGPAAALSEPSWQHPARDDRPRCAL